MNDENVIVHRFSLCDNQTEKVNENSYPTQKSNVKLPARRRGFPAL